MNKKIIGLLIATTLVIVMTFVFNKLFIYKTFEQVVKPINEETIIDDIEIFTHLDNEIDMKTKDRIEDKEIISSILNGFTNMNSLDYSMHITTTNMIPQGKRRESFNLIFNNTYLTIVDSRGLRSYNIVNESEHLKAIELLKKDDDIDWVKF
ncbi:hypothetical protein ACERII_00175 [Evansella sp. AB-rgal1]|uniref:hypothetical protein n=1 Tax=Evansella sp. AB-rgal1 TaxID=3242696 RepID=UPI00359D4B24